MNKHTAAPWKCDHNFGCKDIKGGKDGTHKQAQYKSIAYTVGLFNEEEDHANAKLMASAPRLLKALNAIAQQELSTEWELDGDGEILGDATEGYDGIIQIAREAVK